LVRFHISIPQENLGIGLKNKFLQTLSRLKMVAFFDVFQCIVDTPKEEGWVLGMGISALARGPPCYAYDAKFL
jgi:hypothetical protein